MDDSHQSSDPIRIRQCHLGQQQIHCRGLVSSKKLNALAVVVREELLSLFIRDDTIKRRHKASDTSCLKLVNGEKTIHVSCIVEARLRLKVNCQNCHRKMIRQDLFRISERNAVSELQTRWKCVLCRER